MEEGRVIFPQEIELRKKIGEGQFGTWAPIDFCFINFTGKVFQAECRRKAVAVKVLNVNKLDEETIADVRNEIEVMSCALYVCSPCLFLRKVSHPNVCLYMGVCTGVPGKVMIITELYKESLDKVLFSAQHLSLPLRMRMALDIAMGMNWSVLNTKLF